MIDIPRRTRLWTLLASIAVCGLAAFGMTSASAQPADRLAVYAEHDPQGETRIDYTAFDDILKGVVFEVGRSDRQPARGRAVNTGTRINYGSNSRYRYEANRVVFHALNTEHESVIGAYRAELEALPSQIDFSALKRDEQLAFWLNLHNLVVLDEIAKAYPVARLSQLRVGPDRAPLYDAKIIDLGDGDPISLNDIRFRIVGANWDDPQVIYGFFSGAVGGPTLSAESFNGARVRRQLDANAGEFVNALRGVEDSRLGFRISPLYEEWREIYFPDWPSDVRSHLNRFADNEAAEGLSEGGEPEFLDYDWRIADLTNGTSACGGRSNFNVQTSQGELGQVGQGGCGQLPPHARNLVEVVTERRLEFLRQGRLGSVTIRDIETDETGARIISDRPDVQLPAAADDAPESANDEDDEDNDAAETASEGSEP